jgi:NitT/TauT family transport system permease protein
MVPMARRVALGAVGVVACAALVELLVRSSGVDHALVPPPTAIAAAAARLLVDPAFLGHVLATVAAWGFGLAIATVVGVGLGALIGASRPLQTASRPVIELLRPIPSVALIPLVVLLIGRGLDMKVVLVAYAASWPILLNTIAGVRSIDRVTLDTARSLRLPARTVLARIVVPASGPFVLGGVRIAAGVALVLAVSAELVAGGRDGIGVWMLAVSQPGVDRGPLVAGILLTGALGLLLTGVVALLQRRLVPWRHTEPVA